ncbi:MULTISPECIES: ClpXP protease specificity-enhancing factor [unclassified Methylotenera]|uniref:ClpXP protease specificity-enhancing factor n=1 Tax=unclassified Methylotenera TaxID=2643294 RepID=UPI00037997FD|nr:MULTISPECIES: ClpXP protease specificity-enhancing factor [unclassified Methylotenera]
MTELIPTKPYMIRAIHEWCVDNGLTPHLLVVVGPQTRVPMAYVKDGEIVLNINYSATKDLHIDNEAVVFSARFGGVSQHLYIPIGAVKGIFARENGQGMFFEVEDIADAPQVPTLEPQGQIDKVDASPNDKRKPTLKIVK